MLTLLSTGVNANLRQLIVDQIDDDGTGKSTLREFYPRNRLLTDMPDWEGSCSSSQQMEGVTETTPHVID